MPTTIIKINQGIYSDRGSIALATTIMGSGLISVLAAEAPEHTSILLASLALLVWIIVTFSTSQFQAIPEESRFRNAMLFCGICIGGRWRQLSNYRAAVLQSYGTTKKATDYSPLAFGGLLGVRGSYLGIQLYPKRGNDKHSLVEAPRDQLLMVVKSFLVPNAVPVYKGGLKAGHELRLKAN